MKKILCALLISCMAVSSALAFTPDQEYLKDREALNILQRDVFRLAWEDADPSSGMVFEANFYWNITPVTTGGTGFGIAAIVAAVDRGWINRDQAVERLLQIARFLRDKTPRKALHGAFPHWLNGNTGEVFAFDERDNGADIVETSLLMQGLLIARAYFNGPGPEENLRAVITELWEGVDWNWFTKEEGYGMEWHWSPDHGYSNLKVRGYNEAMITYVLAVSSPTHPISRRAYDYWMTGPDYHTREMFGYMVEGSPPNGGPLFMAQYSFIGLDPRRVSDTFVPHGYFIRNVRQTLSNRGYCLQDAPKANLYAENFWGLTASQIPGALANPPTKENGYAVNHPDNDNGAMAPTASLGSIIYTPHYSMQVLSNLQGPLRSRIWGKSGPYDAISLRDNWASDRYLAIDQLPMVCMTENYRTGLLWRLFMSDKDVQEGLRVAELKEPKLAPGFPEAEVTLIKQDGVYMPDAYDIRRHPDTGLFMVPYWCEGRGLVSFRIEDVEGNEAHAMDVMSLPGRNQFTFPQFAEPDGTVYTLIMKEGDKLYTLPIRLH